MKLGSLCTGYGGLDMAAQAVIPGLELAWTADNDPAAAALIAHRFPEVPNLGDITAVDWSTTEPVDVLTAGFPCQPISNAGQRKGRDDDRWIWPAVAEAVRRVQPGLVVLENVSALRNRGFGDVIADLAALRYDAAWACVRASATGAPHARGRMFIAAWPSDANGPRREGSGLQRATPERDSAPADAGGLGRKPRPGLCTPGTPGVGRGRLGNDNREASTDSPGDRWDQGQPATEGQRRGLDPSLTGGTDWGRYEPAVRRWEHITGNPAPAPVELGRNGYRLAPRFAEWMMGIPAGWVTDVPGLARNVQFKLIGNGVVPRQGAAAIRHLLEMDLWQVHVRRARSAPTPRIPHARAATAAPTCSR